MGKITGVMNIDEYGRRQNFNIKILNFQQSTSVVQGFWNSSGVQLKTTRKELESYLTESIHKKFFKISIKEVRITI